MENNKINFAFFGTPDVASETLEILKKNDYIPSLIITSPDAKAGRGMKMRASPVALFAQENKIPCIKPEKLDEEFTLKLSTFNFQLFVVVAYGKIIPENILKMPRLGSINIHYSLLPKYRGASPVESAILNGDMETGVTIQKMEYKMDSGAIIAQKKVNIFPDEKAPDLRKRLIKIGGELLVKVLQTPSFLPLSKGEMPKAVGVKQDESQATFCQKIKKEDGLIDLEDDPIKNYNKFRAYASWPRTFFFQPARNASHGDAGGNGKRIIITQARLEPARPDNTGRSGGNNKFVIEKIIPENGKETNWKN